MKVKYNKKYKILNKLKIKKCFNIILLTIWNVNSVINN